MQVDNWQHLNFANSRYYVYVICGSLHVLRIKRTEETYGIMTSVLEKWFVLRLCFIKMKSFLRLILNTLMQTTSSIPSSVYGKWMYLWVGVFLIII